MVPSVVFDVPKSSPQIDMSAPEGAFVYPLNCHPSSVILSRYANEQNARERSASRRLGMNTDLILRSLRSKRLEGWRQHSDSRLSFETRAGARSFRMRPEIWAPAE